MRKIINYFKNSSITWKLIYSYTSVIIVPIVIIAAYLYFRTSSAAITQANMIVEQNLSEIKSSILQRAMIMENVSQIVSSNEKIEAFLKNDFVQDSSGIVEYKFDILNFIDNIMHQNNDIYSMRIFFNNPTIPEIYDQFYNIDRVKNIGWYKKFLKSAGIHFKWRTSHMPQALFKRYEGTNNDVVFSFCSKIFSTSDNIQVGFLETEVKESILFDSLRSSVIDKMGSVYVVDGNGVIVSDNKPNRFMRKLNYINPNMPLFKPVNEITAVNGTKSIVISIPVKEIGCNIVGVFPVRNFIGKVRAIIPIIVIVSILAVLILGFVVYLITNALLKRLKTLVKAMKQVRDGNLKVSIEDNSKDEFSELALTFNNMTSRIDDLVETVYKIQIMEREAELRALEVQINPHFLYNTLATISWAARKVNSKEIYQISNSLAKFYRLVLSKGNTLISVRDEVNMVMAYLDIQKIRFEELFDIKYEIDEAAYDYHIIKNILQPLIENSLNHGIQPRGEHGNICMKIYTEYNKLVFEIIDDGVGMDMATVDNLLSGNIKSTEGSGYAIKNIMERLKAYYGDGQLFIIKSSVGEGTSISIKIDLDKVNQLGY